MAYDEQLAARVRQLLADQPDLGERRMFGGLAFLVGGTMAVAASSRGGLMVRVDPQEADAMVATGEARPMEMRGRELRGWVLADGETLADERELARWVQRGTARARALG